MKTLALVLLAAMCAACATSPDVSRSAATVDSDEFRIETTVLAVYNVLSGPAGRRDWNRFEALFAPGAHIVVAPQADGVDGAVVMTPKEYAERFTAKLNAAGSFERPVATRVQLYRNIAHVWSTFERREAANQERPGTHGINSFEMVRVGNDWKVQSFLSQQEDAAHPIPPR
jgi:hypothetical protein